MPTTLAQEHTRATDPAFRTLVRSALFRLLPDVIGETFGVGQDATTQARRDKRHAWAMAVLADPDYWVARAASMVAGEGAIRNVDPSTLPDDTTINARLKALVNDMAGILFTD